MGDCTVVAGLFFNEIMAVLHSGNLRQVGDTENLVIFCQASHLAGDLPGRLTADAGVDFIENKAVHFVLVCKNSLEGEHDPGEFSSARDLFKRTQRLTGIHGNMHGNMIPSL